VQYPVRKKEKTREKAKRITGILPVSWAERLITYLIGKRKPDVSQKLVGKKP